MRLRLRLQQCHKPLSGANWQCCGRKVNGCVGGAGTTTWSPWTSLLRCVDECVSSPPCPFIIPCHTNPIRLTSLSVSVRTEGVLPHPAGWNAGEGGGDDDDGECSCKSFCEGLCESEMGLPRKLILFHSKPGMQILSPGDMRHGDFAQPSHLQQQLLGLGRASVTKDLI